MMKILTFVMLSTALLYAANSENNSSAKKIRMEKQIKKEMEKEKKYAKEQTFYSGKKYDLKGAEVNKDSLPTLPDIVDDDFDMDSVYD